MPEENEGDDDGGRHRQRQAEHAAGIPHQIVGQLLDIDRQAGERARNVLAKRCVNEKDDDDDGEREADAAAQCLDHQRDGDEGDNQAVQRPRCHILGQRRKAHGDNDADDDAERR